MYSLVDLVANPACGTRENHLMSSYNYGNITSLAIENTVYKDTSIESLDLKYIVLSFCIVFY